MKKILLSAATIALMVSCTNGGNTGTKSDTCCDSTPKTAVATPEKPQIVYDNSYFYSSDGKFLPEKAKDAVIALMEYHNYAAPANIREKLWVSDYGMGQFSKLGLAAICPINNTDDLYMLQDLFLLPGQMLPEHWHEKPEKLPVKMEAWYIRSGLSYIVGVGEDNMSQYPEIVIPKCHMNGTVTEKHIVKAVPGMTVKLEKALSRHWQFGGPEGCIMSEVANVHDDASVRHSEKIANDHFLNIQ